MIEFYKKTPVFSDLVPKIKLSTKTKYQLNSVVRMVKSDGEVELRGIGRISSALHGSKSTMISRFLRDINPNVVYTIDELKTIP